MARLIAIDLPGGTEFVDELRGIWDDGDAALPIDQRLPDEAKRSLMNEMRVGDEVEAGDALVVATSGSTGRPKGVVLTHDAVAASAVATSARLGVTADDHWLACLPLSHVGGLSVVTRALATGTRLTVLPAFDAAAVMASNANLVSLVATALARIDPTRFRTIVLGGSRPPDDRPPNCVTTYGLTETGSGVVYDGLPLDGVEIDIVSDGPHTSGDTAASSREGEILVRSATLLRCYRDGSDPKTADGWLPTGDLGYWRADGRLHVSGRRGDLIITGGENVWPDAAERVVDTHPDVVEAMVRGVADDEWGEVVEVLVVPRDPARPPTLDSIRTHVKTTHPAFMAPKSIRLVDHLPRTALGKLRRDG